MYSGGARPSTGTVPGKLENSMTRSREANRGLEFEFDRFRHDDGRPRQFLRLELRIEGLRWIGGSSLDRIAILTKQA